MLVSEARDFLRHAKASGRMAHAYTIVAPPRAEGADFAKFAMKLLACRGENAPCGECAACRQIDSGAFPDAFWLRPAKKSRIISVDQMRRGPPEHRNDFDPPYFLTWLGETALLGGWKFGIIEFADRMNEAASNALLKTLEEPPPETLMLLLTDTPQALLPTIVSRCEEVALTLPPAELEARHFEPLMALLSSMDYRGPFAAHAYSQAILAILAKMQAEAEEEAGNEADATEEGGVKVDKDEEKAIVASLYRQKRSVLVATLQRWLRDILAIAAAGDAAPIHYSQFADSLRERASRIPLSAALANIEAVEELSIQLEARNLPDSTVFPYWLDRIDFGGSSK
ncbi:MAG: hypothetical protein IKH04_07950 [Kiritimatiellae bacterium]|nr:hypothetical protein [Kiritimatiellia bacterium]